MPKKPISSSKELVKKANEVLKNGDPVKYLLDTFASIHKGDYDTAMVLLVSIATQSMLNSDGIHPTLSGESGKGKSHVCKTILHLVPKEYWMNTSLSAKAPFYLDIPPGTIIFSDDSTISEELESAIKRATSDFQETTTHTTVSINRKGTTMTISPRISWWLANVDSDMSAQMINRQFGVTIDETTKMDEEVRDFQLEKATTGEIKYPITDEVLICREIMRIVKETLVIVTIPFAKNIVWNGSGNRRNLPIFLDIVKAFAILRAKQRVVCGENEIEASIDDYNDAKQLYGNRAETQSTKLNDMELKLVHILASSGDLDTTQIQNLMGTYQTKIHNLLHGRNGSGGLLSKVPELTYEKASVPVVLDNGTIKNVQKNIYRVRDDFNVIGSYGEVVSLNKNGDAPTSTVMMKRIAELMRRNKGSLRYFNTDRGFSLIAVELENDGFDREFVDDAITKFKKTIHR